MEKIVNVARATSRVDITDYRSPRRELYSGDSFAFDMLFDSDGGSYAAEPILPANLIPARCEYCRVLSPGEAICPHCGASK